MVCDGLLTPLHQQKYPLIKKIKKTPPVLNFFTPFLPFLNVFTLNPSGDEKHENVNLMSKLLIEQNYHLNKINRNIDLNTQVQ